MRNLALLLLFPLLGACGASALDTQVTAASVTRVALDAAAESIEIVCDPQRVEAAESPAEYASKCLKALEGHDTSRAAWNTWAAAIVMSEGDEEALDIAWGLVAPVLALYGELSEFLAEFDVTLPNLDLGRE